jgi:Aspartyl protease
MPLRSMSSITTGSLRAAIVPGRRRATAAMACLVALASSCFASPSAPDFIPLKLVSRDSGERVAYIDSVVDGSVVSMLLDTGSASTSIAVDNHTRAYPALESAPSRGVSGVPEPCDVVLPGRISLGSRVLVNTRVKRCGAATLGIDLLARWIFQVDFPHSRLALLTALPPGLTRYPLTRLRAGHIVLPIHLDDLAVNALFDTGSDATVVDLKFLEKHRDLFVLQSAETGYDAAGHPVRSDIYLCRVVTLGRLRLQRLRVATFDFGETLRTRMEGAPVILGTNVISKAVWSIDTPRRRWTMN